MEKYGDIHLGQLKTTFVISERIVTAFFPSSNGRSLHRQRCQDVTGSRGARQDASGRSRGELTLSFSRYHRGFFTRAVKEKR